MIGNAMCELGEIKMGQTTPKRFVTSRKLSRVVKYGANRTPSAPIISTAMLLRANPYSDSVIHCHLVGTILGLRYPTRKKIRISATASHTSSVNLVSHGKYRGSNT